MTEKKTLRGAKPYGNVPMLYACYASFGSRTARTQRLFDIALNALLIRALLDLGRNSHD